MPNFPFDTLTILESLQEGIYLTDSNGDTCFVNASYEKMTGINRDDVIGKNVVVLENLGVFSPITNPSVVKTGTPMTVMQTNKTGRKVVVTGYPIRCGATGKVLGAITIVRDITILEKLKQEIDYQRALIQKYQEVEHIRGKQDAQIIAQSDKMHKILALASRLASVDTPVLITGETGSGKEVIAKMLHNQGSRMGRTMLSVNCAAIPEHLVESEFFGYAPGAFTGANLRGKAGLFELADQGTLFLDEIGELPLHMQAKLLRVLQDQEIMRVGGNKVIKVNVRIIAATHCNLEDMVKMGRFRQDLLYRLRVASIEIPPLRERAEDIEPLIKFFLERFNLKYKKDLFLTLNAMEVLRRYQWPGNVRELENVIHSLMIAYPGGKVDAADLPAFLTQRIYEDIAESHLRELIGESGNTLNSILGKMERKLLIYTMEQHGNDPYKVAEALGCDRTTIQRKLKKYKINLDNTRRDLRSWPEDGRCSQVTHLRPKHK